MPDLETLLTEIRRLDPSADLRPGSVMRSVAEAAARQMEAVPEADLLWNTRAVGIYAPHVPLQVSDILDWVDAHAQLRAEIEAEEDRQAFEALDRASREIDNPRVVEEPWYVERRGVNRVRLPEFEISSNPTIPLNDVRVRRLDLIDRMIPSPLPEPVSEMTSAEMQEIALIVRRTC